MTQTIFAGIAILIGVLGLLVGLMQCRQCSRRSCAVRGDQIFELEAAPPRVRLNIEFALWELTMLLTGDAY